MVLRIGLGNPLARFVRRSPDLPRIGAPHPCQSVGSGNWKDHSALRDSCHAAASLDLLSPFVFFTTPRLEEVYRRSLSYSFQFMVQCDRLGDSDALGSASYSNVIP